MWHLIGGAITHVIVTVLNLLAPYEVDVRRDVAYAPGPSHRADVYRSGRDDGRPILVFLYGGGWRSGSKETVAFVGAALARRGLVVVIPEYRHVPEAGLTDILADNAAAVAWTVAHALELGGDPRRVVVAGHSSGAWAAAMLALDARWLGRAGSAPSALAGAVGLAGPYAVSSMTEAEDRAVFDGSGPEMEPINDGSSRAPPMLLLAGSADGDVRPLSTSALAERVRALGGAVETRFYDGLGHDHILNAMSFPFALRSSVADDIVGFVDRVGPRGSPTPPASAE